MGRILTLHSITETELEAPALAWSSLAWYWGLSFLGMGPRYIEYMQSGEAEIDKAFYDESNDACNHIIGYDKNLTIKQRFDRAVNFYEYCFIAGKRSSINPPWDHPPDLDTMIALRNRFEANAQPPDEIIKASTDSILEQDPAFQALWEAGGTLDREQKAIDYAAQVKSAMAYIQGEVAPRMQVTQEQLDKDTGFLVSGDIPNAPQVTVEDMDEAMPDEKQWEKLGDVYVQTTPKSKKVKAYGIIGRYYNAGHNLETAMWSEERKRELSGIHHAIVRTWHQLMEINSICIEKETDT